MESQTLYRKYRPHTFEEVIGQDSTVSVLQSEIKEKTFSHAYLFAGSRGTGKTSVARIVARELGISANDLFEIDAASNRGIEDIRDIRESVQSLPFDSEYKVYIIDEVHMLTKEAFNALLKTLEEPPSYVIFILATTEIEKLPETIISRCESYTFTQPNQKILTDHVLDVAKKEKRKIDQSSAELIALLGNGSFRDTLGILQKIINSSTDATLSAEEISKITGAPRRELIETMVSAIASKNSKVALAVLSKAVEQNIDITIFSMLLLQTLRYSLLYRFGQITFVSERVSSDELAYIKKVNKTDTFSITSKTLARLLEAHGQIGGSAISELPLELALIDLLG